MKKETANSMINGDTENKMKNVAESVTENAINGAVTMKAEFKPDFPSSNLELKPAYHLKKEIGFLFSEYTDLLISSDPVFQEYLKIQNYEEELSHLEKKYGLPDGRLYAAFWQEQLAGCIGLRRIDKRNCEMKRLYVRPEFRKNGIGDQMIAKIIADSREIGYSWMLLDTLPFLTGTLQLYKKHGFYEIDPYNDSPMENSIYMRLDLK